MNVQNSLNSVVNWPEPNQQNQNDKNLVTLCIGNLSFMVTREQLAALDPHLEENFTNDKGMKEAREATIFIAMPDGVSCAEDFMAFVDKGIEAITGDNAIPLLELAVFANISSLGEQCVEYILKNWSFNDDFEGARNLLEYVAERESTCKFLGRLYCNFFKWLCCISTTANGLHKFIQELPEAHVMRSMYEIRPLQVSLNDGGIGLSSHDKDLEKISRLVGSYVVELIITGSKSTLCSFPNLKMLEFARGSRVTFSQNCEFLQLETIIAKKSWLRDEELVRLSEASPKLKLLDIEDSQNITTLKDCSFSELEELNILFMPKCTSIPPMTKLKKLSCSHVETLFSANSFPFLEELHFYDTKCTPEIAVQFTNACKNLKRLTMKGCDEIDFSPINDEIVLPKLEELTIERCAIRDSDSFTAICNISRGAIKKLTLKCIYTYFDGEIAQFSECNFSELTHLEVNLCAKSLSCDYCGNGDLRHSLRLDGAHFPKLVSLDIENFILEDDEILDLSISAKDTLENLRIKKTKLKVIGDWQFSRLKDVKIIGARIIDRDIQRLSQVTANSLNSLFLSSCYGLTSFEGCSFPHVTEFTLQKTNVDQAALSKLETIFPKLRTTAFSKNRT